MKTTFEKTTAKFATKKTLIEFFMLFCLTLMIICLSSCATVHRCPTYGYKKIEVNGKKHYIDPGKRSPFSAKHQK